MAHYSIQTSSIELDLPSAWQVPLFDILDMMPRVHDYCVVVCVINEGDKFLNQLSGMQATDLHADVVVADGGSIDGSTDEQGLRQRGVRALLTKRGPGKLSAQLRTAFSWALVQGYKGVVVIDGNGKDGYEAIPLFVNALCNGYGFVQGSRYIPGGQAKNTPWDRMLAVRLLHAPLISLAAGFRYTDTTNGFRAFSSNLLRDPRVDVFRDVFDTYNLHFYLAIRAARLGYNVCEIPVSRSYPLHGRTPTKISGFWGRLHILRQLFLSITGAYNPVVRDKT